MLEIKQLVLNYEKNFLYSIKDVNLSEGGQVMCAGKKWYWKINFFKGANF